MSLGNWRETGLAALWNPRQSRFSLTWPTRNESNSDRRYEIFLLISTLRLKMQLDPNLRGKNDLTIRRYTTSQDYIFNTFTT